MLLALRERHQSQGQNSMFLKVTFFWGTLPVISQNPWCDIGNLFPKPPVRKPALTWGLSNIYTISVNYDP